MQVRTISLDQGNPAALLELAAEGKYWRPQQ